MVLGVQELPCVGDCSFVVFFMFLCSYYCSSLQSRACSIYSHSNSVQTETRISTYSAAAVPRNKLIRD